MSEGVKPPGPTLDSDAVLPPHAQKDQLSALTYLARSYGDLVHCPSAYGSAYFFNRPDYVRHFLNSPAFVRTELLKTVLGEGSLTADGPPWKKRRRLIQPGFDRTRIEGFAELMVDETLRLAGVWERLEGPVDVDAAMMRLTLTIVVRSLFSAQVEPHVDAIDSALKTLMLDLGALTSSYFGEPVSFPPDRNRRIKSAVGELERVVFAVLNERRSRPQGEWPADLLTMLLTAKDPETEAHLDDRQLRDELVTLLVAGHETTATMLSWAFYALSTNPEVEATWHADLDRRFPSRDPSAADLAHPTYTRDLVQETLRMYPPVWAIARRIREAHTLDGFSLEAPAAGFISPYLLHRHPTYWPEPERFEPLRFSESAGHPLERYAYIPFGRGPHTCTGQPFALLEGQLILAVLGRRFRLRVVEGHTVRPRPLITLRLEGGLPMKVERRN